MQYLNSHTLQDIWSAVSCIVISHFGHELLAILARFFVLVVDVFVGRSHFVNYSLSRPHFSNVKLEWYGEEEEEKGKDKSHPYCQRFVPPHDSNITHNRPIAI